MVFVVGGAGGKGEVLRSLQAGMRSKETVTANRHLENGAVRDSEQLVQGATGVE